MAPKIEPIACEFCGSFLQPKSMKNHQKTAKKCLAAQEQLDAAQGHRDFEVRQQPLLTKSNVTVTVASGYENSDSET